MNPTKKTLSIVADFFRDQLEDGDLASIGREIIDKIHPMFEDLEDHGIGSAGNLMVETPLLEMFLRDWVKEAAESGNLPIAVVNLTSIKPTSDSFEPELARSLLRQSGEKGHDHAKGQGRMMMTRLRETLPEVVDNLPDRQVVYLTGINSPVHEVQSIHDSERQSRFSQIAEVLSGAVSTIRSRRSDIVVLVEWPKWLSDKLGVSTQRIQPAIPLDIDESMLTNLATELVERYDRAWRSGLTTEVPRDKLLAVLTPKDNLPSFGTDVVASNLDELRTSRKLRTASVKDKEMLVKAIPVIASEDKSKYSEKRNVRDEISTLSGKDIGPVLVEIIDERLGDLEKLYGEELEKHARRHGLDVEGSHPEYSVVDGKTKRKFHVEVRVPYGYVLVDGTEAPKDFPTGVVEEIVHRI